MVVVRRAGRRTYCTLLCLGTLLRQSVDAVRLGTVVIRVEQYAVGGSGPSWRRLASSARRSWGRTVLSRPWLKRVGGMCVSATSSGAVRVPRKRQRSASSDHVMLELSLRFRLGRQVGRARPQQGVRTRRRDFDAIALPGGIRFAGILDRAADRLGPVSNGWPGSKQLYDPENVFCAAIPLRIVGERWRRATARRASGRRLPSRHDSKRSRCDTETAEGRLTPVRDHASGGRSAGERLGSRCSGGPMGSLFRGGWRLSPIPAMALPVHIHARRRRPSS